MLNCNIIICTEKGYLESIAKLLVSSVRTFGGALKDVPIISYQPRKLKRISKETIRFFEQHQVIYNDAILNTSYLDYPLANKALASAHAANNYSTDIQIFLDTDTFFINEPAAFLLSPNTDVAMRPVDIKNIGVSSEDDSNYQYWKQIYHLLDVKERRYVKTSVDQERIFEYYNSGHVVAKQNSGLFQQWKENFEKIMASNIRPHQGPFYVEQSSLSATISALKLNVTELDNTYNFPIHLTNSFGKDGQTLQSINQLISIHYHSLFKNPKKQNPILPLLMKDRKGRQVEKWIKEYDVLQREIKIGSLVNRIIKKVFK